MTTWRQVPDLIAQIAGALQAISAQLGQLIKLLTPPNTFRILIGGKPAMAINIVHDADHETLSIQEVDSAGQPAGPLDPSVVVTWAIVTDPNAPNASVTLTPNADNQTCQMTQNGMLATGVVISATAQLPGQSAPETEQATFNVVAGPGTSFVIEVGSESAN